ncbi:MAG: sterol desaturase family protein [Ghiorsea sp.]
MEHEALIRLTAFLSIVCLVVVWELILPKRQLSQHKGKRWLSNVLLVGLDAALVKLVFATGAVGVALWASAHGVGLLNMLALPWWVSMVLAVVMLDLIIYWQHRLFHRVPMLWRLHQVHHADRDIDVSTGLRFHPVEIMLSMLIKGVAVLLLGEPVLAVVLFEVVLNGMAMFNHGNIRLPKRLDGLLRLLVVTPDMHRVHHSLLKHETNSNYGFNIALWDRIFGSYHAQPDAGHGGMTIGLEQYQKQDTSSLLWMLRLPFVESGGRYAKKELNDE